MKYTPDEVARLLANRPNQPHYVKALIAKCVTAAVLAEREDCAGILDRNADRCDRAGLLYEVLSSNAKAIRARGQQ